MRIAAILVAALVSLPAQVGADPRRDPAVPLVPVAGFDRAGLLGDWFEVAQTPTLLQRDCHGTTARVELRDDSRLTLRIACPVGAIDGPVLPIEGIMVETEPGVFVTRMVRLSQLGNLPLVVIWRAPDQSLVAIAAPLGQVGWVWARSPRPDADLLEQARQALVSAGYPADAVRDVPQAGG